MNLRPFPLAFLAARSVAAVQGVICPRVVLHAMASLDEQKTCSTQHPHPPSTVSFVSREGSSLSSWEKISLEVAAAEEEVGEAVAEVLSQWILLQKSLFVLRLARLLKAAAVKVPRRLTSCRP